MSLSTLHITQQALQQNKDHTFFAWSTQGSHDPILIDRAKGVYLYDTQGNRHIDFSSQLMNVNIGHGRTDVMEAVMEQMKKVSYVAPSFATEARGRLGAKMAEISPGNLNKCFFTLAGADSIDNAIILARLYTGKHKIISHYRSYHGATIGSVSVTGDPRKLQIDANQAPNFIHVENPYSYRCPWYSSSPAECGERAVQNLRNTILYEGPQNIAAILMEGESGTSGCIKYPPFYLKKVKALCEEYGILFIADEVMSGFSRTGKWFAVEHHEITPDIMCFAKGITAGYIPLGGIIVSDTIAQYFQDKNLPLGSTYSSHPLSCATALAVIDIYEKEKLANRAVKMGAYIDQKVAALQAKHASLGDWRNTGMLGCIEVVKNRETKEALSTWNTPMNTAMQQVKAKLRELGLFTFVKWSFIFVAPPLTITEAEVDEGMAMIDAALEIADRYYEG